MNNTFDPEERKRLYRELMPIVQADMPLTFLHPFLSYTAAHRRVRGIRNLGRINLFQFIENIWVEEDQ